MCTLNVDHFASKALIIQSDELFILMKKHKSWQMAVVLKMVVWNIFPQMKILNKKIDVMFMNFIDWWCALLIPIHIRQSYSPFEAEMIELNSSCRPHISWPWIWLISPWTKWPLVWQTTISNAFSWMKLIEFRSQFHWHLFPGV